MNKEKILQALQQQLESDLKILKNAALATYEDATHEESKPENKYDTRALEASYLAGAQAARVNDVAELIVLCKALKIKTFSANDPVAIGALVEVVANNKKSFLLFLSKGGGVNFSYAELQIQVITPASPLGKSFIGLYAGDSAVVETGAQKRTYEIISII